MDFTISTYKKFLTAALVAGYRFQTFRDFLDQPEKKVILLRHDVDRSPRNALLFAELQKEAGICGTYYFRIVKDSFDPDIIRKITGFGHEIGYHYEDMNLIDTRAGEIDESKMVDEAIKLFEINLEEMRDYAPVKTICMHGSPWSMYDNRLLWKYYDYRNYGLTGEVYFDVDFSKVLYMTDTGRRWNGTRVSVRDKLSSILDDNSSDRFSGWKIRPPENSALNMTPQAIQFQNEVNCRATTDIIRALSNNKLPDKIMLTFHPQRWTDRQGLWFKELISQTLKNQVKWMLNIVKRH